MTLEEQVQQAYEDFCNKKTTLLEAVKAVVEREVKRRTEGKN